MNFEGMNQEQLVEVILKQTEELKATRELNEILKVKVEMEGKFGVYRDDAGEEKLQKELLYAKESKKSLVVTFVDFDNLKYVNNNFGHSEGNEYLISVVDIMKENIRGNDFIFKYGGDEFPAIYRVDRIKNLVVTNENFKIEYSSRFQDGDFRKKIQFMYSGRLQRVVFEFWGSSVEAVLDRIPSAKISKQYEGKYLIEAEVYGDGIIMWLLSQGSNVKVLSPQRLVDKIKAEVVKLNSLY